MFLLQTGPTKYSAESQIFTESHSIRVLKLYTTHIVSHVMKLLLRV